MSMTRRHSTRRASIPSAFPWCRWLSSIAASRLCAALIAAKSPVKCRLMSSIGSTCAYPPPAAPPFTPEYRTQRRLPRRAQSPMPQPLQRLRQPDRRRRLPLTRRRGRNRRHQDQVARPARPVRASMAARVTLPLVRPYGSISSERQDQGSPPPPRSASTRRSARFQYPAAAMDS